jgi:hypothetical protein
MLDPHSNKNGSFLRVETKTVHYLAPTITGSVPSQSLSSRPKVPFYILMVIMYSLMGEPKSSGASHLISTVSL